MAENNSKSVTIRVEEEIHKPARLKLAELDTSFQKIVCALLEQWIAGDRQVTVKPGSPQKAMAFKADIDRLTFILEHGTAKDREWIQGNLKNFEEAIRSRELLKAHVDIPLRKRAGK